MYLLLRLDENSDDDFEDDVTEYRTPINKSSIQKSDVKKTNRKILSSESDDGSSNQGELARVVLWIYYVFNTRALQCGISSST